MKYTYTVSLILVIVLLNLNPIKGDLTCGSGCPLCLLGICLISAPINIAVGIVSTITSALKVEADLNILGILTIQNDLTCDGKINLLGGILVVNGLIVLKANCVIVVQNEAMIQTTSGTKTIFQDLTLSFLQANLSGISSKLTMSGDFDMIFKTINGTSPPIFNMIDTKSVNFTKSSTAGIVNPISMISINYNNNFQLLSITSLVVSTLEIFNSNSIITIPNASIQTLLLRNVLATGINEAKNLIDLLNSNLEFTNSIVTSSLSTIGSIVKLSCPLTISTVNSSSSTWNILNPLSITNLVSTSGTIWNLNNGGLTISTVSSNNSQWNLNKILTLSTSFQFDQSNLTIQSENLNLLGIGTFLKSPLSFLNTTIQQTLSIGTNAVVNLINDVVPTDIIKGSLEILSISNGGQLNLGSLLTSPNNLLYSLGSTQILVGNIGGTIQSLGSLQIAGQLNPISNLNIGLKNLLVTSNNLELKGGSLNILNSITYLTKGTLKLTDNLLLGIGGLLQSVGGFTDQLLNNVDAILDGVILSLDNFELPNRLQTLPNSTIQINNITLESNPIIDLIDLLDLVLVISDEDEITCNGSPQSPLPIADHSQYQFICDERILVLRLVNCTGYTCDDGRCVNDASFCPGPSGICSNGLVQCWNGDCALSFETCKPLPECGANLLRCLDGCHNTSIIGSNSTCSIDCTGPSCINPSTPYFGCGFNSFQCPNGACVGNLSECCQNIGVGNCTLLSSINKPSLSYTVVDSNKDMMLPIVYHDNYINQLDIYGYIQIPNGFYSSTYNNKLKVNKLTDSYLSTINGSLIWGNSSYRESTISLAFDLSLETLVSPHFDKPIQFELKVPNIQSYNLTQLCLYFINVTSNSWQCMSETQLSISNKGFLVGTTNHFTSFAVLLQSYSDDDDNGNTSGGGNSNTSGGSSGNGNNVNGNGDETKKSSISRTTLIIMVSSICGGIVIISIVAGFIIHKTIKHGGIKYWWTMRKVAKAEGI